MDGASEIRAAFAAAEDVDPIGGMDPRTPQDPPPDFPGADEPEPLEVQAAVFPLNDYGNGQRFGLYFGADVLFVPRVGWFVWDGRHWKADDDKLEVRRHAQKISALIDAEAEFLRLEDWEQDLVDMRPDAANTLKDLMKKKKAERTESDETRIKELSDLVDRADEARKKLASLRRSHHSHAKAAGNTGPINNMLTEAQVANHVPLDRLNADPFMINTEGGVLRFVGDGIKRGNDWALEVLDHDRQQYLSKMMPVEYDAAATCPVFMGFLKQILPADDVREFLQRWFGYTLTGRTDEQKLAFFYGNGRNGKSTLVDLIAKMMGAYATTVPIETLTGADTRKGSDATPDLVRVPGARMVRASEPENGQKMKEAMIKSLTGGEAILVRKMQQEFVEVDPEFKLTIQGNYKPDIRGTDDGIWRRILLVPFDEQIAKEDIDLDLPQKLWDERAGILNWMLEGTRKWLRDGLCEPEVVIKATDEYRLESDPVLVFINEHCVVDGDDSRFEKSRDLIDAFKHYQASETGDTWGNRTISNHFKDKSQRYKSPTGHKFTPKKISDTGYGGISISSAFKDRMNEADVAARYGDQAAP